MLISGVLMFALRELLAGSFAGIFVGYDDAAYELAVYAIKVKAVTSIRIQ